MVFFRVERMIEFVSSLSNGMIVLIALAAAALGGALLCGLPILLERRSLRRLQRQMEGVACPACGGRFGVHAAAEADFGHYLWNPEEGFSVRELDLPDRTLHIQCPNCGIESEYRDDGRYFDGGFTSASIGDEM